MIHRIKQICHKCAHSWAADIEIELDTKAINYLNSDQEMCPMCSHDSEGSHDCWKCYEDTPTEKHETA